MFYSSLNFSTFSWQRLWPVRKSFRLLWLHQMASVLLQFWDEKPGWSWWEDHVVQGHRCFFCFSINQTYAGFYRVAQNFCRLAILCILRELIFPIRTVWFFLLEINFCDFQKVLDNSMIIFSFLLRTCNELFIISLSYVIM